MGEMKLYNYQQRTLEFCQGKPSVILSIEMGLGKTAAIIHYLQQTNPKKVLIVAPKRVAETVWKQEADKWKMQDVYNRLHIAAGSKAQRKKIIEQSGWLIIGRDNLSDVEGMRFDTLVIDELSSFKNFESKRSQIIYSIVATQRIGLTGTIISKGAIDLFGQFVAVGFGGLVGRSKKEIATAFYRWRATHFKDKLAGSGLQFQDWRLVTPMADLIKHVKPYIFTLTAADWMEIPQVQYATHDVELSAQEMKEYLNLNTMLNVELDGEMVAFDEAQKFAKLQTLCNGFVYVKDSNEMVASVRSEYSTKLDHVVDFVSSAVSEGEQVLLFYAFKEEKLWLEEKLKKQHIKFTDAKQKNFLTKWNEHEVDVLMAHPASAGHGLNLHERGARITVWSTIPYDMELWLQANARLARQGQKKQVQIHSFVAARTVEVRKVLSLAQKGAALNEFTMLTK